MRLHRGRARPGLKKERQSRELYPGFLDCEEDFSTYGLMDLCG